MRAADMIPLEVAYMGLPPRSSRGFPLVVLDNKRRYSSDETARSLAEFSSIRGIDALPVGIRGQSAGYLTLAYWGDRDTYDAVEHCRLAKSHGPVILAGEEIPEFPDEYEIRVTGAADVFFEWSFYLETQDSDSEFSQYKEARADEFRAERGRVESVREALVEAFLKAGVRVSRNAGVMSLTDSIVLDLDVAEALTDVLLRRGE